MKLVRRDGHRIDAELAKVDGDFADGLDGVGVDQVFRLAAESCEFGDRLNDAGFVVGEHDADNGWLSSSLRVDRETVASTDAVVMDGQKSERASRGGEARRRLRVDAGMLDGER